MTWRYDGALYVVEVPGFAKVGFAANPRARLRQYRTLNPHVTEFSNICDGLTRGDEAMVHGILARKFARHPQSPEWFVGATAEDCRTAISEVLLSRHRSAAPADITARASFYAKVLHSHGIRE